MMAPARAWREVLRGRDDAVADASLEGASGATFRRERMWNSDGNGVSFSGLFSPPTIRAGNADIDVPGLRLSIFGLLELFRRTSITRSSSGR